MSAIAFCFSIRVVVAFFVGNVVQLLMTINIPEMTIKRNENGTCALGRTIGKFCVYVGLTLCNWSFLIELIKNQNNQKVEQGIRRIIQRGIHF